jgi:hypothetical protein
VPFCKTSAHRYSPLKIREKSTECKINSVHLLSHAVIDGRAVHEYEPEGKAAEEIAGLYGNISKLLGLYTGKRKAIA